MAAAKNMRSIYIDDDVWKKLRVEAAQSGSNVSKIIREAIDERWSRIKREKAEAKTRAS